MTITSPSVSVEAPTVLDIKGRALDDRPGIRSVVFFQGCPLSCGWCHNLENYRNLLVRISGNNAHCASLNKQMQLELIERVEYGL